MFHLYNNDSETKGIFEIMVNHHKITIISFPNHETFVWKKIPPCHFVAGKSLRPKALGMQHRQRRRPRRRRLLCEIQARRRHDVGVVALQRQTHVQHLRGGGKEPCLRTKDYAWYTRWVCFQLGQVDEYIFDLP